MAVKKPVKKAPTKKEIDEATASVEEAIAKLEVEEVETETEIVVGEDVPKEEESVSKPEEEKVESSEQEESENKESSDEMAQELPEEKKEESSTEPSDEKKEEESTSDVGSVFTKSSYQEEKSGGGSRMIITICLIIIFTIIGFVGGYFYGKGTFTSNSSSPETSETVPTLTPTPTEAEDADLSAYSIEILNGSGVAGVAGIEQEALETDGFTVENTGNAENKDFSETVIAVKSDVSEEFTTALRNSLEERYVVASGTEKLAPGDSDYDVVVTIGSEEVVDE